MTVCTCKCPKETPTKFLRLVELIESAKQALENNKHYLHSERLIGQNLAYNHVLQMVVSEPEEQ